MNENEYFYDDDYASEGGEYVEAVGSEGTADVGMTSATGPSHTDADTHAEAVRAVTSATFSGDEVKAVSPGSVVFRLRSLIERTAKLHYVSPAFAAQLLRRHGFNEDVANEEFLTDPERHYKELGVTAADAKVENTLRSALEAAAPAPTDAASPVCELCAFEDGEEEGNALLVLSGCGHVFCLDCWTRHVGSRLHSNDSLLTLRCLAYGCKQLVSIFDLAPHLPESYMVETTTAVATTADTTPPESEGEEGDAEPCGAAAVAVRKLVERSVVGEFIARDARLYFCANPQSCDKILYCPSAGSKVAVLLCHACGFPFCARCKCATHAPATCAQYADWMARVGKDGASTAHILRKTKPCPKCNARIEKNNGCNHMRCRCSFEFCWICGGDWRGHNGDSYNCRAATVWEPNSAVAQDTRHFFDCFQGYDGHVTSLQQSARPLGAVRTRIVAITLRVSAARGAEVPSEDILRALDRAEAALRLARNTLACTYIADFYQQIASATDAERDADPLERHRRGLAVAATEELSVMLVDLAGNMTRPPLPEEIVTKAAAAQRYATSLFA